MVDEGCCDGLRGELELVVEDYAGSVLGVAVFDPDLI